MLDELEVSEQDWYLIAGTNEGLLDVTHLYDLMSGSWSPFSTSRGLIYLHKHWFKYRKGSNYDKSPVWCSSWASIEELLRMISLCLNWNKITRFQEKIQQVSITCLLVITIVFLELQLVVILWPLLVPFSPLWKKWFDHPLPSRETRKLLILTWLDCLLGYWGSKVPIPALLGFYGPLCSLISKNIRIFTWHKPCSYELWLCAPSSV